MLGFAYFEYKNKEERITNQDPDVRSRHTVCHILQLDVYFIFENRSSQQNPDFDQDRPIYVIDSKKVHH